MDQQLPSDDQAATSGKPFITTYDPITLQRIESIEEVHISDRLAKHEKATASDKTLELYIKAWNDSDMPKEERPWDRTTYYRLTTPDGVTIASWDKQKLVRSIIDNKRISRSGKIVPLFKDGH